MKSSQNGTLTFESEILNVSQHSFWIFYNGQEYQIPFDSFPWFKKCSIESLYHYEVDRHGNFHWPELDVDLNIDILENTENYPLVSK
jgi:hypothetical protein